MSRRRSRVNAGSSAGVQSESGSEGSDVDTERTIARAIPSEDVVLIDKLYSKLSLRSLEESDVYAFRTALRAVEADVADRCEATGRRFRPRGLKHILSSRIKQLIAEFRLGRPFNDWAELTEAELRSALFPEGEELDLSYEVKSDRLDHLDKKLYWPKSGSTKYVTQMWDFRMRLQKLLGPSEGITSDKHLISIVIDKLPCELSGVIKREWTQDKYKAIS